MIMFINNRVSRGRDGNLGVVVLTIFFVLRNKDTTAPESERVAVLNPVLCFV